MRAIPQKSCAGGRNPSDVRGIVYYRDEPSEPTTSGYPYVDACVDEPVASLIPQVALSAGTQDQSDQEAVSLTPSNNEGVVLWAMNNTSFYVDWKNPTLLQLYNNNTYTRRNHVISFDQADSWIYVIIEAQNAVAHPIHLHGHDFSILAQGSSTFNQSTDLFSLTNPMRRDVALLPGSGHLVLAFKADNPGIWLMHCHIGWHANQGLALQFVERAEEARALIDYELLNKTCADWGTYTAQASVTQGRYDDGI